MAIPFEGRLAWRRGAPFHVQLELDKACDRQRAPGETNVHGVAVRVFRTDGRLGLGDHVKFRLWVCRKGDEPTGPAFIYEDAFANAAYMEAYLAGGPPVYELAAYEFCVLGAPSDHPVLTTEELQETVTRYGSTQPASSPFRDRKRWKFWK